MFSKLIGVLLLPGESQTGYNWLDSAKCLLTSRLTGGVSGSALTNMLTLARVSPDHAPSSGGRSLSQSAVR